MSTFPASTRQLDYITDLLDSRDLSAETRPKYQARMRQLVSDIELTRDAYQVLDYLTSSAASALIDALLDLPVRTVAPVTSTLPAVGDTHTFTRCVAAIPLYGCRNCQRGAPCGRCDGLFTETVETITQVIHWADNSIEIVGDQGSRATVVTPHGDVCF